MRLSFLSLLVILASGSITAQTCFFASASTIEATPGSNVCVKVNTHNYEDIVGMQWTMNWDSTVLEFTATTDYGLTGLVAQNFGTTLVSSGVLNFTWANPSFTGTTEPDRLHAFSVCFDVIGILDDSTGIDFTDSHTDIEVIDGNFEPIPFQKIPGEVLVKGIVNGGEKLRSGACIINPSCLNGQQSNLRFAIEGGQDPISISWEGPDGFTSTDYDLSGIAPGTYTVNIQDGIGFQRADEYVVKDLIPRLDTAVVTDVRCYGQQNGSINITIHEGTTPYSYEWSNGLSFEDISSLLPGNYSVTFTDSIGCSGTASFEIDQPDSIIVSEPTLTCPGLQMDNGIASYNLTGGTLPYVFFWSTGEQTSLGELGNLPAGNHMVTISDGNNCPFIIRDFTLENGIDSLQDVYFTCGGSDVPLNIYSNNAVSYNWSPADLLDCTDCPVPNVNTTMDTMVNVTITTASGCTQSAVLDIQTDDNCVWPGDNNNDGIANYLDVLWIGIANGSVGPARTLMSTNWLGQGAEDWMTSTLVSNIDYKYIDSDGNGEINGADIDAINNNYDQEHNFLPPEVWGMNRSDVPPLLVSIADTVEDNTPLALVVELGSTDDAIASAHGLAFQIEFDAGLVDPTSITFEVDGWLGNDLWKVDRLNMANGIMEIGVTRSDGQGISGAGQIGILNLSFNTVATPTAANFNILNAYLINENEGQIEVSGQNTSTIVVDEIISSLQELDPNEFNELVSPNPFDQVVKIESSRRIDSYEVLNLQGQLITRNVFPTSSQINMLPIKTQGIYLLRLIGKDGVTLHRLMKS